MVRVPSLFGSAQDRSTYRSRDVPSDQGRVGPRTAWRLRARRLRLSHERDDYILPFGNISRYEPPVLQSSRSSEGLGYSATDREQIRQNGKPPATGCGST